MIDLTYGHLADDADDHDRGLLDACDRNGRLGHVVGTLRADSSLADRVGNEKDSPFGRAFLGARPRGFEPMTFGP